MKPDADERNHVDSEKPSSPVPVENLSAGYRTVISIICATFVVALGWVTIRGDLMANSKEISLLSKKVDRIEENLKAFDRLAQLQADISDLRKNGSDAVKALEKELYKLQEELRLHIATTTTSKDK